MIFVTCVCANDKGNLIRGEQYQLLLHDKEKGDVVVRGTDGRRYLHYASTFDFENRSQALLTRWRFDDPVCEPSVQIDGYWTKARDENYNSVEVAFQLSDGTMRWCLFVTPDYMKRSLAPSKQNPHNESARDMASWGAHIITIHDLKEKIVETVLLHLDAQNELIAHSLPLDTEENDSEDTEV